ncbi:MAG TPA: caspase family protein, partial [Candidatus Deferrimicrobium sp.]
MKKALLVGINRYPDPGNELKGCVNDVRQMADTLKSRYGFAGDGNMRILTDARATTKAILDG